LHSHPVQSVAGEKATQVSVRVSLHFTPHHIAQPFFPENAQQADRQSMSIAA
jgi:hypothetical protein